MAVAKAAVCDKSGGLSSGGKAVVKDSGGQQLWQQRKMTAFRAAAREAVVIEIALTASVVNMQWPRHWRNQRTDGTGRWDGRGRCKNHRVSKKKRGG